MIEHLQNHTIGLIHVVTAFLALACGTSVIFIRKGGRAHVWLGRGYLVSMLALNGTSLLIYEVFQSFGPFHWLALTSLVTVILGYLPAKTKDRHWKRKHAFFMAGSYVGLLAATAAEIASRVPGWSFGPSVLVSSAIIIFVGMFVMFWRIPKLLRK